MQWLGPRVSFSLEDAGGCGGGRDAAGGGGAGKASADFEFLLAGCSAVSTMLPADELFSGGKLVPLRLPSSSGSVEVAATRPPLAPAATQQQQQQPETPRSDGTQAQATKEAVEAEQAAEEPKVPARRWRDLLRMRKQQASSSSSSTETKPLRRLLRRGPKPPEQEPSLSLPLLRDPNEADKPAPAPASAPSPTPPPPVSTSQHQLPPKIRLTAA